MSHDTTITGIHMRNAYLIPRYFFTTTGFPYSNCAVQVSWEVHLLNDASKQIYYTYYTKMIGHRLKQGNPFTSEFPTISQQRLFKSSRCQTSCFLKPFSVMHLHCSRSVHVRFDSINAVLYFNKHRWHFDYDLTSSSLFSLSLSFCLSLFKPKLILANMSPKDFRLWWHCCCCACMCRWWHEGASAHSRVLVQGKMYKWPNCLVANK